MALPKENTDIDRATANETVWDAIQRAVHKLHYGMVTIVVHDGQIVQMETLEKTRFPASSTEKRAGQDPED